MPSPPQRAHVRADIDPEKAPETAANIREHAAVYGAETMITSAKELNTKPGKKQRLQEAIGHLGEVPGMDIDEEAYIYVCDTRPFLFGPCKRIAHNKNAFSCSEHSFTPATRLITF